MKPIPAAFFCNRGAENPTFQRVFANRARLLPECEIVEPVITDANFAEYAPLLQNIEAIFATWGLWRFSPAQLALLPNLKAVFYAAGSVQGFAAPLLEREILVVSAWAANAVPVAEWTLGQILLAGKGFFRNERENRALVARPFVGRGNYGATVSVLGAGQVGSRVIEFLRPFHLEILVFDPFLSAENARKLGIEKVDLSEAFRRGDIVSNHIANLPATRQLISGALLASLPQNATFINTGRGATVETDALTDVLRARPDLTALLDVTEPEPLPPNHPLRALPNAHLTTHIAGSIGDEVTRMGDLIIDEFMRWRSGQTPIYAVTPAMLETMA